MVRWRGKVGRSKQTNTGDIITKQKVHLPLDFVRGRHPLQYVLLVMGGGKGSERGRGSDYKEIVEEKRGDECVKERTGFPHLLFSFTMARCQGYQIRNQLRFPE